jgi:hypothetical protein
LNSPHAGALLRPINPDNSVIVMSEQRSGVSEQRSGVSGSTLRRVGATLRRVGVNAPACRGLDPPNARARVVSPCPVTGHRHRTPDTVTLANERRSPPRGAAPLPPAGGGIHPVLAGRQPPDDGIIRGERNDTGAAPDQGHAHPASYGPTGPSCGWVPAATLDGQKRAAEVEKRQAPLSQEASGAWMSTQGSTN